MRRKDRSALSMPAAVQRSTIWPSRQRVTLRLVVRAMEIIDSERALGDTGAAPDDERETTDTADDRSVEGSNSGSSDDQEPGDDEGQEPGNGA
jgi:hypothetical protein